MHGIGVKDEVIFIDKRSGKDLSDRNIRSC